MAVSNESTNLYDIEAADVERDEMELVWAALERFPSRKRSTYALIRDGEETETVDVTKLDKLKREIVVRNALDTSEQDNFKLLSAIKERLDRVGIEVPKVDVCFQDLTISAKVQVGSRALPTLINYTRDLVERLLTALRIYKPRRHKLTILNNISGVVKPGRMTLLLGPPGSGKSTLLLALAGKLDSGLKKSGNITYNGHMLDDFCIQRTSAYISQTDNHIAELTVRETLDFAARCEGASEGFAGFLKDLTRLEKEMNIRPSPEIDAFMKASSVGGRRHSISTDYILKVLGLDICAETVVGSDMNRGVSGGQRKRVTTGEMVVGPRKTLFMDEISTGLDSSTTYQIVKCLRNFVHLMEGTVLMALLQPAPETFELFDDLILLSEGYMVYQGPRAEVVNFFESIGFRLPPRKGVADFLQEVTSRKDQAQYWADPSKPYVFLPVSRIAEEFLNSRYGSFLKTSLSVPYDKSKSHPSALARTRFFRYMFLLFTIHQMALGLFRSIASIARDIIIANTFASAGLLVIFLLGGFIIPKDIIKPWWIWAFWISPLSYGQRAISVNEFTATRWMEKPVAGNTTIGLSVLHLHSLPADDNWYWLGVGVLLLYTVFFNLVVTLALSYLNPIKKSQTIIPLNAGDYNSTNGNGTELATDSVLIESGPKRKGMILPFQPLTMTFRNVDYFVDMPKEMRMQGIRETKLQLLSKINGVFSPGVLTALVGASGAGKTTLMDVLAGRKTGGYIEGDIRISGHPKDQQTFARISGYVEQNDIHSPQVTVYESILFSSGLRLPTEVNKEKQHEFVEQVMQLVELDSLRNALVGLPGSTGLSTEQRKRLTIAVELVANPSIIFMDEPTSGLDARAAAIVMRTVRNTVDTQRTVGIPGISSFPDGYNPATWMLEISTPAAEERIGRDFADIYRHSDQFRGSTQDLQVVMGALFSAVMFLGVNNAASVQPVVSIERTVFYREKAAGMYSPFPYAAAQGLVEIPYILMQTLIYGVITYFMINFERTTAKFFLYLVFMFLTFTYFTFYGMMATGLTPTQHLASVISSAFYSLWNLLAGFLVPKPKIPGWWIWFYYICPISWTLRGIITSQLGDVETMIEGPGFHGTVKKYLEVSLGYGPGMVGASAAILVAFCLFFFAVFAISVKVLNFQKR
ncbi:hypothetical protein AgCh_014659 [Apium graveolens]